MRRLGIILMLMLLITLSSQAFEIKPEARECSIKYKLPDNKSDYYCLLTIGNTNKTDVNSNKVYNTKNIISIKDMASRNGKSFVVYMAKSQAEINLKLTDMIPVSDYSLEIIKAGKTNKTVKTIEFSTLATEPSSPASHIAFLNTNKEGSIKLSWKNGSGSGRIIVASKSDNIDLPKDGIEISNTGYGKKNAKIGKSTYTIFKTENSKINTYEITGLEDGVYSLQVIEYNGSGKYINYNLEKSKTNPRSKATSIQPPTNIIIVRDDEIGILLKWKKSISADRYEIDLATDKSFNNIIPEYQNLDIGNLDGYMIVDIKPETQYFFRIRAVAGDQRSNYSKPFKIIKK